MHLINLFDKHHDSMYRIPSVLLVLHDSERRACRVKLAKLEATANVPKVLIPALEFFNVCGQVRVDHADIRVVEAEADGHGSFVAL